VDWILEVYVVLDFCRVERAVLQLEGVSVGAGDDVPGHWQHQVHRGTTLHDRVLEDRTLTWESMSNALDVTDDLVELVSVTEVDLQDAAVFIDLLPGVGVTSVRCSMKIDVLNPLWEAGEVVEPVTHASGQQEGRECQWFIFSLHLNLEATLLTYSTSNQLELLPVEVAVDPGLDFEGCHLINFNLDLIKSLYSK
jgi:hypothetical protein